MILEHLVWIVAVTLFIWSVSLVWATWQLHRLAKELDAEERELRRWKRLQGLHEKQHRHWN